ncbi:hypothetical protein RA086_01055 [Lactiplantibacillus sp. WILCCON 0030]|uniref:Uncharacterized protein n=1 Tax=Lactiplantibacillus brownii TaxID=3069269 RepID=A0ABU1A5P6_9LACO|nr:hypothetical protein [Lactiplantibacillus brownii]MDQ7936238.1 hypothetical protein [Lactiplantibacillus brownii]
MNLVVGPFLRKPHEQSTHKFSMYAALERVDECLRLITKTGILGLTNSTATLGLNLTHLLGVNVVVTNDRQTFTIIVQNHQATFSMTGCIIQDTFHNILNPTQPGYLISLNRQLISNSDDLIETLYSNL